MFRSSTRSSPYPASGRARQRGALAMAPAALALLALPWLPACGEDLPACYLLDTTECETRTDCHITSVRNITHSVPAGGQCYIEDNFGGSRSDENPSYDACAAGSEPPPLAGREEARRIDPDTGQCMLFSDISETPPTWLECDQELSVCDQSVCASLVDPVECNQFLYCDPSFANDITGMAPDGTLCRGGGSGESRFFGCKAYPGPSPPVEVTELDPVSGRCYSFPDVNDTQPGWGSCESMPLCADL